MDLRFRSCGNALRKFRGFRLCTDGGRLGHQGLLVRQELLKTFARAECNILQRMGMMGANLNIRPRAVNSGIGLRGVW